MAELTKIACVEDDPDIRKIVELALGDIGGFDLALFPDGASALAQMEAAAPQLIILDVMMPGLNGVETLEKLRTQDALKETPALFMTARAQPDEQRRYAGQDGAIGVITKPFDPMTLADTIRTHWEKAA